jgi:hypothetical protein
MVACQKGDPTDIDPRPLYAWPVRAPPSFSVTANALP